MCVRKALVRSTALLVVLGLSGALPVNAQTLNSRDRIGEEFNAVSEEVSEQIQDAETVPWPDDSIGDRPQSLQDLEVSVTLDRWDLIEGAAIAPASGEPTTPTPSDIAQGRFPSYRYSAGLDLPNFGWVKMEGRGIDSILGINATLGVSYKKFFQPALADEFNWSWGAGTFALILPYASIGGDYQWDSGWFVGGNVGASIWVFDDFFPFPFGYIGVGYRW